MERIARAPAAVRAPIRGSKRTLALRSDAALVQRVRAGDEVAFEVLYERHVAGVLGYCRHMLGSQQEAEDAVQQAFVSAHGSMRRGSREIAFKPWLYTIARNRCVSVLRARREQPAELPELSTAGLNEQVERRADLRELLTDLQRLPEQQRAALVLSELGDLSHAEIAEVIGSEPPAVKGLVFRARAALAERRDARAADCGEIRLELASAKGGALRRGRLRYHLDTCPDCTAYLVEVRRQRKLLGIALPIVPTVALKDGVMSSLGIGAGAVGATGVGAAGGAVGAATAGGASAIGGASAGGAAALLGGTAVKLAVAGALVAGGAGIATEVVRENGSGPPPPQAPPAEHRDQPGSGAQREIDAEASPDAKPPKSVPKLPRAERNGRGRQDAGPRSAKPKPKPEAGQTRGKALGKAVGRDRPKDVTPGIGKAVRPQPDKSLGKGSRPTPNPPKQPKAPPVGRDRGGPGPPKDNATPPAAAGPPANSVGRTGLEPVTSALSRRRSPN
jgi:RNA polymerase sigma factor (sigma-70 family)